jgi:hypothetical protein
MSESKGPKNEDRYLAQTHETVGSIRRVEIGSSRKWGSILALAFGLFGLWPLFRHHAVHWWLIILSGSFLAAALLFLRSLDHINRTLFSLCLFLDSIISPIVMGTKPFTAAPRELT